jgi:hypothetical protein
MIRLLGVARDSSEAALMISTGAQPNGAGAREAAPPPQLYSAPDPEEDPEAQVSWLCVQRAGQLLDFVCSRFRATTSLSANSGVLNLNHVMQRGMENLALLAVQAQNVISSGNAVLNATQVSVYPMFNLGMRYTISLNAITRVQHAAATLAFNYCACVACAVF